MASTEPVIDHAAGPQRNSTARATSSGSMSRFTALRVSITFSNTSSSSMPWARAWSATWPSTSGVRTYDGQMACAVTCGQRSPASRASVLVKPTSPCLADT
jgi:hypothetical protein